VLFNNPCWCSAGIFFILSPMKWYAKTFHELSIQELYDVLKLRVDIFVVEQNCPYEEIDGKDNQAIHILGYKDVELTAYCRVFPPGAYYDTEASIGRVAVARRYRKSGLGIALMKQGMNYLKQHCHNPPIKLAAQLYLEKFYHDLGFETISEVYPWDGIDHVDMNRDHSSI